MKWFYNLGIGVRLRIGFGAAIFLFLILSFISVKSISSLETSLDDVAHDKFKKTIWANDISSNVNVTARALRNVILLDDENKKQEEKERIKKAAAAVDALLDSLNSNISIAGDRKPIDNFVNIRIQEYFPARDKFLNALAANDTVGAKSILFGELRTAQTRYLEAVNDLIVYQRDLVNQSAAEAAELSDSAEKILIILSAGIAVLLVVFSIVLIKGIVNPLQMVKQRVEQLQSVCMTNLGNGLAAMSEGNLDTKVEKSTKHLNLKLKDEIGQVASTVDKMITQAQAGLEAYEVVRERIKALSAETGKLIEDSKEGKLDNRGEASKFRGAYREIVEGVNGILDAVIKPVQDGAAVLEVMAEGDLTARVTAEYKGQHQNIKNSINKLGNSLSTVITKVTEAVQATASASSQISSSTEEMAAGAQEQSAQTGEVAAAVEQMTKTILETTNNASRAAENAKSAGKIAEGGGNVVEETISGINAISIVVARAAETVGQLGKNSDQIGEIIQVIDDIADQTNLLALNAAIEAARAGEQGRGFAVVADEVRKLAERTTKATKEIANMIKQIQRDTADAVVSMNKGTEEVDKGKALAVKSGSSLKEIIGASVQVVDNINQVASASEEQSATAEQISKNIEAISNVSHETAAGIQQVAKAAEDLNKLTDNLQNLVSRFKVTNEEDSYYSVRPNGKLIAS